MPVNIDYKPKTFEWNTTNIAWLKSYLTQKSRLLNLITDGVGVDIANINLLQFNGLCTLLEKTAEGRELRTKMFKAWRSKKSRDSNNGKKIFTFNLDVKAGLQLKKLADKRTINKTLEDIIYGTFQSEESLSLQAKQLKAQKKIEKQKLQEQQTEEEISIRFEVKALATQEKSELIRIILKLNKQLKMFEERYQERQKP
ncbi:hypothetical protein [Psychromonas antarctica]|uniref:hypothetical protein n=1 Tax=Psychromonas antarctica TaxID=67573 RepID=UPI001EE97940|nr:hypothetical protein [Psychromonas antarctica]MCG6202669.1 hypothetical protein [Psychromonas antarctica]